MIEFDYHNISLDFDEVNHIIWLSNVIKNEGRIEGDLSYLFCDDDHLHKLNVEFLNHDTLTDIITFDNSFGNTLSGDICISIDRVLDNAKDFGVSFDEELRRVLVHGVLHLCGYKDKSKNEAVLMREKEEEKMHMFHVEQ